MGSKSGEHPEFSSKEFPYTRPVGLFFHLSSFVDTVFLAFIFKISLPLL